MEAPVKRSPPQQQQQAQAQQQASLTSSNLATAVDGCASSMEQQQQQIQPPSTAITTTAMSTTEISDADSKLLLLEKFASLLGTGSSGNNTSENDITTLLSNNVSNDDIVLMIPSLDLQLTDTSSSSDGGSSGSATTTQDILPQMGAHSAMSSMTSVSATTLSTNDNIPLESMITNPDETIQKSAATTSQQQQRPDMEASILKMATNERQRKEQAKNADSSTGTGTSLAQHNIGTQTSWTKSTIRYASNAVGTNINNSFTKLYNSRLRTWTLLLLRHSLKQSTPTSSTTGANIHHNDSRTKLLCMLNTKIQISSNELYYKTLPLPDAAKNAKPIDSDIILPLLFEVVLHLSIQDKPEKITLRAPGTISAIVDERSNGLYALRKVNVQLDTSVFLKSMVDQARIVVLKAVASVTETPLVAKESSDDTSIRPPQSSTSTTSPSTPNLSNRVSTKRPTTTELTRMQKARKSALRLNSVLHGKTLKGSASSIALGSSGNDSAGGLRQENTIPKVSSVRWDTSIQSPKLVSTLSISPYLNSKTATDSGKKHKLESYKSFGRPHGGDFGSGPRNATFGEYGRPAFAGLWGRDGRLAAHPMPSKNAAVDSMGNLVGGSADLNATFDNTLLSNRGSSLISSQIHGELGGYRSSAALAGAALLGRLSTTSSFSSQPDSASEQQMHPPSSESTMIRSATALESSLMKKLS